MTSNEWKDVSIEAKLLIKKMLAFEPDERISAENALKD